MKTPFKRIVVGVDLSRNSLAAYHWLHDNIGGAGRTKIVHAIDTPRIPTFVRKAFPHFDEWMTSMKRGCEDRLRGLAQHDDVLVESVEGSPVDVLLAAARDFEAELIAVGGQGRHEGLGKLVGSTAERLVERAGSPVLVVRGPGDRKLERILVAIDESPMAREAALTARALARARDLPITLLTVVSTWLVDRIRFHASSEDADARLESMRAEARTWLKAEGRELDLGDKVEYVVETGAPDLQILQVAQRSNVDLIVMGTRGDGVKAPPFIGGCARFVLRNAHVPVLFMPGRAKAPTG